MYLRGKFKDTDSLTKYLDDNTLDIAIDHIGLDRIIESLQENEGPISTWSESHGFSYGPYEEWAEYRDDFNSDEIFNWIDIHEPEILTTLDSFIFVLRNEKEYVDKLINLDDSAYLLFDEEKDPIREAIKKEKNIDYEFFEELMEMCFC